MTMARQNELMQRIFDERDRQDAKLGEQPRHIDPSLYLAVLMEEVGEVAKTILENDSVGYPIELIQVAAVCLAALEDFYKGDSLYSVADVCGKIKPIDDTRINE